MPLLVAFLGAMALLTPSEANPSAMMSSAVRMEAEGNFTAAEKLMREAVAVQRNMPGIAPAERAAALNNLASLLQETGRLDEAASAYREAVSVAGSAGEAGTVELFGNFAVLELTRAHYDAAADLLQHALAMVKRVEASPGLLTARLLASNALLVKHRGQYDRAEELGLEALRIQSGRDDRAAATTLNNLGDLYFTRERFTTAADYYERSLALCRRARADGGYDCAQQLNNLALAENKLGRFDEAVRDFSQAIDIWQKRYGPKHRLIAAALNNEANAYAARKDYKKARALLERAAAIWRETLGEAHPDYASALGNLASVVIAQHKFGEAERLDRQALEIDSKALPAGHPKLITDYNNLALACLARGKYEESEALLTRGLAMADGIPAANRPSTASLELNFADLLRREKRYRESAPHYQRAIDMYQSAQPPQAGPLLAALDGYTVVMKAAGEFAAAEKAAARATYVRVKQKLGEPISSFR